MLGGGSVRYWLVRGMVIADSSGKPSRWVGAVADITGRKHDEENLARLAAIVRDSCDAIIGVDLNDAIVSWNAGAERLYGYSAGEMMGRSISVLVPEECSREQQHFLERMKAGEWLEHVETVRLRRDGSRVFVSLTASPIRDTEGNLIGLSKTARDITARKRAEAEIRAMDEELRRLSVELLRSQDEERRRIARELHDSTGQSIAALTMNLELLSRVAPAADPRVRSLLEDSIALAKQSSREVRDLCYLLHPPLLDELGLPSALRAHIDGFSKRTGIKVDLRLPPASGACPRAPNWSFTASSRKRSPTCNAIPAVHARR